MKRRYLTPEVIVTEMELAGMLCISGSFEGDAEEPAKALMPGEDWFIDADL